MFVLRIFPGSSLADFRRLCGNPVKSPATSGKGLDAAGWQETKMAFFQEVAEISCWEDAFSSLSQSIKEDTGDWSRSLGWPVSLISASCLKALQLLPGEGVA